MEYQASSLNELRKLMRQSFQVFGYKMTVYGAIGDKKYAYNADGKRFIAARFRYGDRLN